MARVGHAPLAEVWSWRVRRRAAPLRTFRFAGRRYRYQSARYNTTWENERAVEVPIALAQLDGHDPAEVLEVGNVLAYYTPVSHDVVDKMEPGPNVRNVDIMDFRPEGRYRLILSISTLEHVGWDYDEEREPGKAALAVEHMAGLLADRGTLFVTFPVGYNPPLDTAAPSLFDELRWLKRVSRGNRWREIDAAEAKGGRYNHPYKAGNVVAVGTRASTA